VFWGGRGVGGEGEGWGVECGGFGAGGGEGSVLMVVGRGGRDGVWGDVSYGMFENDVEREGWMGDVRLEGAWSVRMERIGL